MERLLAMSGMGSLYESDEPELAGVRFFPVTRFRNYLVFYRPTTTGIEVLRVLHGARDIESLLSGEGGWDGRGTAPSTCGHMRPIPKGLRCSEQVLKGRTPRRNPCTARPWDPSAVRVL